MLDTIADSDGDKTEGERKNQLVRDEMHQCAQICINRISTIIVQRRKGIV